MIEKLLRYRNVLLGISALLVVLSVLAVVLFGFKLGIDFTSGSLWQVEVPNASIDDIRGFFLEKFKIDEVNISLDEGSDVFTLSLRELQDTERQEIVGALKSTFGEEAKELDFWSVSPIVSKELSSKAWWAVGLVMVAISLYITFAFRKVAEPVRSWKYGLITLLTLVHDVVLPAGLFAFLGKTENVFIDINFMVALLVVMGFSVHDTIVVFDRIRENLIHQPGRAELEEVVNKSVTSTMARSINTSLTLVLVLLALYFFGPISLKHFILAIMVGTIAGTYSSIFVASPLLLLAGKRAKSA